MSAEFLHEIDETLRTERMKSLWEKYRVVLFVALGVVFAGLAGYEWNKIRVANQRVEAATAYWLAVKEGEDNATALARIQKALELDHEGYRTLAALRLGNMYASNGDRDLALAAYERVAADKNAHPVLRDMGILLSAQNLMTTDAARAEQMLSQLRTTNSAFMFSAMEFQAILSENQGNKAAALNLYKQLLENDNRLPSGIRDRAGMRVAALEAERNSR
jgi:hypothetical protein